LQYRKQGGKRFAFLPWVGQRKIEVDVIPVAPPHFLLGQIARYHQTPDDSLDGAVTHAYLISDLQSCPLWVVSDTSKHQPVVGDEPARGH